MVVDCFICEEAAKEPSLEARNDADSDPDAEDRVESNPERADSLAEALTDRLPLTDARCDAATLALWELWELPATRRVSTILRQPA
jgi:hypothetical protein